MNLVTKLRAYIKPNSNLNLKKGEINYEAIGELKYIDKVINETLRMFPPGVRTDRICDEDFEYNGMKIPKGSIVTAVRLVADHASSWIPNLIEFFLFKVCMGAAP